MQTTCSVPDMSCSHCRAPGEVGKVAGVTGVDVDLDAKRVTVTGAQFADADVRTVIDDARYDVA